MSQTSSSRPSRAAFLARLTGAALAAAVAAPRPAGAATPDRLLAAGSTVHVRLQGHIVALGSGQIKVRDRRDVVHTVLLTSSTTYWYKLQQKSFHDLQMGMRVYVLGLPTGNGAITALKIHLYYPRPKKIKTSRSTITA